MSFFFYEKIIKAVNQREVKHLLFQFFPYTPFRLAPVAFFNMSLILSMASRRSMCFRSLSFFVGSGSYGSACASSPVSDRRVVSKCANRAGDVVSLGNWFDDAATTASTPAMMIQGRILNFPAMVFLR